MNKLLLSMLFVLIIINYSYADSINVTWKPLNDTTIQSYQLRGMISEFQQGANHIVNEQLTDSCVTGDKIDIATITNDRLASPFGNLFVGTVLAYGGTTAPDGWVICDGTALLRSDYNSLYSIIGVKYGNNTGSDFKVPDLRARIPVGYNATAITGIDTRSARPLGEQSGEESHRLTLPEIPVHGSHYGIYTQEGWNDIDRLGLIAANEENIGGDKPHENRQMYQIVNYIIFTGVY